MLFVLAGGISHRGDNNFKFMCFLSNLFMLLSFFEMDDAYLYTALLFVSFEMHIIKKKIIVRLKRKKTVEEFSENYLFLNNYVM